MCGVLPGGKSITAKRVPLAGGAVPRSRAPVASIVSPIGIFAGAPSVHHIMVETSPACGNLALVAGASSRTGHAMGIVARHPAPNRRVLWVLHSICPRTWFADARLASAWQSRHPRPGLYLEHRQRLSLARWYLCTMFFSLAWPMHT